MELLHPWCETRAWAQLAICVLLLALTPILSEYFQVKQVLWQVYGRRVAGAVIKTLVRVKPL
jgi:hypothetical protein